MNKKTVYIFVTCCILLFGCKRKARLPDLKETYSYKDTKPFGAYISKRILDNSFPDNVVQTFKAPFAKSTGVLNDTSSVYFCVTRNLFVDDQETDAILNFVYNGNTAFFAAANFDTTLLNKIFCKVVSVNPLAESMLSNHQQTTVSLFDGISLTTDSSRYYYNPFANYFSEINDRYCREVGYNAAGKTNCIVFFWGKGKLFLHTDPRAFSNYFLLTQDNYKYIQGLMQVLHEKPEHVYWDDYYNKLNSPSQGESCTLCEIFRYPPLKAAFWLLLAILLLYILFGGKRRQRITREIKPNQNSSVAFTETIARLYLQRHDNKNIADKMITYFYEYIRNHYFLTGNPGNKEFITALSRKSGVPEEKTTALFHAISHANENNTIDDYQLLSLNEQIQQFYKKRK